MRTLFCILAFFALVAGCSGSGGSDGLSALMVTTAEPAGENCTNGGTRVDFGVDDNADGVLDAEEIGSSTYICHGDEGADGDDGPASLIAWTEEPVGTNCPNGGTRVDSGLDDDADGVLDVEEIDSTTYICHGVDGATSLVTLTNEPPGANCPAGGQKVETGLDDDADGVLEAGEIDSTTYVCHGAGGATSLISMTAEPAGANCLSGGQKVEMGLDDDADGVLDASEVESTVYICHGTDGDPGATGLIAVIPEADGSNCADGGQRVDSGLDDNGDGSLDATEIDHTSYVCDGAGGLTTLVSVTPEAVGANCAGGGQKVETGLDDNGNGTLEAGEVSTTVYVCHGEAGTNGTDGLNGLVAVTAELAGANCLSGGQRLQTGLDADANGVLDASEVESTVYVCDGEDGVPQSCDGYRIGAYLYLECDDGTRVTWYVGLAPSSGLFVDSGQSLGNTNSRGVSLGDVDGDGDLDAFVGTEGQGIRVWLNDGSGLFVDSGQSLGSDHSYSVSLGDVDGDGDLDAFVANYYGEPNRVWLNDGSGVFSDSGQSLGGSQSILVTLGDVDEDGDLDAFVANNNQPNRVWLNDGSGNFTDSGQTLGNNGSHSASLGDVDGDGDLDAFVGNYGGNRVWLNDGSGLFTDSGQSLGSDSSEYVSLGDVDGDGDLDAFIANLGEPNRVWLNDGSGTFTDSGQSLGSAHSHSASLGDVDGDGDLDAFVANHYDQPNRVWLNDGSGTFTDSGQSLGSSDSVSVRLGDVDGDGDLDAFVTNYFGQPNRVWLNQ
jgi:FG-GAP-like repeat